MALFLYPTKEEDPKGFAYHVACACAEMRQMAQEGEDPMILLMNNQILTEHPMYVSEQYALLLGHDYNHPEYYKRKGEVLAEAFRVFSSTPPPI